MEPLSRPQGEGGLSQIKLDVCDRAGDGGEGASPNRSYQTAQQQVRTVFPPQSPLFSWALSPRPSLSSFPGVPFFLAENNITSCFGSAVADIFME